MITKEQPTHILKSNQLESKLTMATIPIEKVAIVGVRIEKHLLQSGT